LHGAARTHTFHSQVEWIAWRCAHTHRRLFSGVSVTPASPFGTLSRAESQVGPIPPPHHRGNPSNPPNQYSLSSQPSLRRFRDPLFSPIGKGGFQQGGTAVLTIGLADGLEHLIDLLLRVAQVGAKTCQILAIRRCLTLSDDLIDEEANSHQPDCRRWSV